jgi:TfoX N-terminal domain
VSAEEELRERYEDLIDALVDEPGVTPPTRKSGFGRSAIRYEGKIFAMFVRSRLVLKLPEQRVSELVAAGHGIPFDANKGVPYREWLSLTPGDDHDWLKLATEALEFARANAN